MKYLRNLKSFLTSSKPKLNILDSKPPTKDVIFKPEDVIETLNDVLCELEDYNIDIRQSFVDKFTITISKDQKFHFFDIKDKVSFALEIINHSFILNEVGLSYKEGSFFADGTDIEIRLIKKGLYGRTLDKIEGIKNFKITSLIIDFYIG